MTEHTGLKILVTGATGFIGRNLVDELSKSSGTIFCLIRKTSDTSKLPAKVRLIYADITDLKSLSTIDEEIDIIFHCAAYVDDNDREKLFKVNVEGTENVCKLALRLGVKRMVYTSSVAVVSGNTELPLEEDLPYSATNVYGESKIEAEKIAMTYRKAGLKMVIIRPPMVYGEDEPHMMKKLVFLIKHRLMPLLNDGSSKLHLAYVKTVADAMIFSLGNEAMLKGTFFVADEQVFTLKEIAQIIAAAINAGPPRLIPQSLNPIFLNIPYFGKKIRLSLKNRVYSTKRLAALGFKPKYEAATMLALSAKSFMDN